MSWLNLSSWKIKHTVIVWSLLWIDFDRKSSKFEETLHLNVGISKNQIMQFCIKWNLIKEDSGTYNSIQSIEKYNLMPMPNLKFTNFNCSPLISWQLENVIFYLKNYFFDNWFRLQAFPCLHFLFQWGPNRDKTVRFYFWHSWLAQDAMQPFLQLYDNKSSFHRIAQFTRMTTWLSIMNYLELIIRKKTH